MTTPLPPEITIRPAVREDDRVLRAMIRRERLNPLGFHWRNFLVAEDSERRIIGIGAVKTHGDGSREVASIATEVDWRGRGTAGAIIRTILKREDAPGGALFLTCRDAMKGFYERFGFHSIGVEEMPPYFRRLYRLVSILTGVMRRKNQLTVMKREI